jgi:hypothetical protein
MSHSQATMQQQGGKGNSANQIKRAPRKLEGRKPGNTNVKRGR